MYNRSIGLLAILSLLLTAPPLTAQALPDQMVTHTSGRPDVTNYHWDKPEYDDGALERFVRSLHDKTLRWAPGKDFRYSNMAFEVLGDVVAKASSKTFEDYVDANILKPVGMK